MRRKNTSTDAIMRTKRKPRFAKNANQPATRGVRLLKPRLDRPNPYGVQWSERVWDAATGRDRRAIKTLFFPTAADAAGKAAELRAEKRAGTLRTMTREEIDDWLAFRAAIQGERWQNVVAAWQAHAKSKGLLVSDVTVGARIADYLGRMAARVEQGSLDPATYSQRKGKLNQFAAHFRAHRLGQVLTRDIAEWLDAFKFQEAGTFNNYLKIVSGFFSDAVFDGLLEVNPCARVRARPLVKKRVEILTVPQTAALLHTALTFTDGAGEKPFVIGLRRLALETFAGIRFGSTGRLAADDVKMDDRGILHPAASIKTRKQHYVEGFPDNLWQWLQIAPDDRALTHRQYLELKSRLFGAARVPHPRNCLRHGFPTYHLAVRKDPGLTAYLLCHRNQKKLWEDYKGNATEAEGRRFESLTPATVAALAQEWVAELEQRTPGRPPGAAAAPSTDQRHSVRVRADE